MDPIPSKAILQQVLSSAHSICFLIVKATSSIAIQLFSDYIAYIVSGIKYSYLTIVMSVLWSLLWLQDGVVIPKLGLN